MAREQLKGNDDIRKRVNALKNLQLEAVALVNILDIKSILKLDTYKYLQCVILLIFFDSVFF